MWPSISKVKPIDDRGTILRLATMATLATLAPTLKGARKKMAADWPPSGMLGGQDSSSNAVTNPSKSSAGPSSDASR